MSSATATVDGHRPLDVNELLDRVTHISSLPEVTARIVALVEDPHATARDLRRIVESDPALAARVLRVVNSAFYGLPAQVASLQRAVLLLGLNAVKNIALATSLSRLFRTRYVSDQLVSRDLWRHSVAAAVWGRLLATRTRLAPPDEVFVAGLVHDLGLIVEYQLFPEAVDELLEECAGDLRRVCAAEERRFGINHQRLGEALAARWGFPAALRHAILHHHDPADPAAPAPPITRILCLADQLSRRSRPVCFEDGTRDPTDEQLAAIGLAREQLTPLAAEAVPAIEQTERVLRDE